MDFAYSPRSLALQEQLSAFMAAHIVPAEAAYHAEIAANTAAGKRWTPLRLIEELKLKARADGLWNLFLPDSALGAGLSNQDYAPLAEIMGRTPWASEVFNCSAPDTGNMEVAFDDVRVPVSNILLGEGRGFEIAQRGSPAPEVHHLRPLTT